METTLSKYFEFRMRSGFLPDLFATVLLSAGFAVISGCAGTATGKDTSVYSSLKSEEVSSQKSSEAAAMVVIRYPAMIHTNAENLYVSSFCHQCNWWRGALWRARKPSDLAGCAVYY